MLTMDMTTMTVVGNDFTGTYDGREVTITFPKDTSLPVVMRDANGTSYLGPPAYLGSHGERDGKLVVWLETFGVVGEPPTHMDLLVAHDEWHRYLYERYGMCMGGY